MKKKVIIVLLIFLAGIAFTVFKSCSRQKQQAEKSVTSQVKHYKQFSVSEESYPSANEEATNTLERADKPLSDGESQQIKESLVVAFDYLNSVNQQSDVEMSYQYKLSITNPSMGQTMVTMLEAGYQLDLSTVKVYESDNDNVYQFTVDLIKDGSDNLSIAGNYVTGTQQLELASLHGIPTGIQY